MLVEIHEKYPELVQGDMETLDREVNAWTEKRNEQKKMINWKFAREKADKKMSKYYV